MEFFLHPHNIVFTAGYGILLLMLVLELAALLMGMSFLNMGDDVIDFDVDEPGSILGAMSFLNLDKVPLMIWLATLVFFFASAGLSINFTSSSLFAMVLPTLLSVPIAAFIGLALTKRFATVFSNVVPKNESYHISEDEYPDYIATISVGTAKQALAARATFTDKYNTKHTISVIPLPGSPDIEQGTQVVLVQKQGINWLVEPLTTNT